MIDDPDFKPRRERLRRRRNTTQTGVKLTGPTAVMMPVATKTT
jgi:hypothetical protein